ncbi:hypothetical protein [Streptomyces daliensis]|uniref:Uncharacterized protein n=1 Tax=Streptomyces daliensis TaxID=299421 RepID=A0A8T4ITL4_9ACTN|nr:hypothetical protein [Streptomyces daliensis]
MTDRATRKARRTADALAYACAHADEIREALGAGGAERGPLDEVLDAVRGGGDGEEALNRLHERLRSDGDARGLYGHVRGTGSTGGTGGTGSTGGRIAGVSSAMDDEPGERLHVCPHRRCTRNHWASEVPCAPPVCAVDGTPLPLTAPSVGT